MEGTGTKTLTQDNSILVGKKPAMNYVLAVVTQFNNGASGVRIKARGNAISRAVDVAEIVKNRFFPDLKGVGGESISIGTEELSNEDGSSSKVSSMQLILRMEGADGEVPGQENTVYVGKKPAMNYVLAVVTQFNNGARSVRIKARGNSISRAVDVAEIARNRFIQNLKCPTGNGITIDSEELTNEDGSSSKVSSIAILLER